MPYSHTLLLTLFAATLVSCSKPATSSDDARIQQLQQQVDDLQKKLAEKTPPLKPAVTRKSQPDFLITSDQFMHERWDNDAAFAAKYKNKTVLLVGRVEDIHPDNLQLSGYGGVIGNRVICEFDTQDAAPLANLRKGAQVKVVGVYEGGGGQNEAHIKYCALATQ